MLCYVTFHRLSTVSCNNRLGKMWKRCGHMVFRVSQSHAFRTSIPHFTFRIPHFTGTRTTQWVVVQNSMRIEFAHTHLYTNREHSFELKLASLYDREQSFYSRHQLWHLLSLTFCECRQPLDLLECSTNATISSTASKFPNRLQATDILPKIKQINTI